MSKWSATMPANIALIKYMGKYPGQIPSNPSLSVTVPRLTSTVTLAEAQQDHWKPTHWSLSAQNRFLSHLNYLKSATQTHRCFSIQSENNFPDTCGLASSASSFAALTHAFFLAVAPETPLSIQASHSRMGSGSSCRSFLRRWFHGLALKFNAFPTTIPGITTLSSSMHPKKKYRHQKLTNVL